MSADRETPRVVRSWLDEGVTKLPDRVLDAVLDQVPATPQRRSGWSAWRSYRMNTYARLAAAAAAILIVGVVGYQLLPRNGGVGGQPTIAPSPTPSLLAKGSFAVVGHTVTLDATGSGDNVSGIMDVTSPDDGVFTVSLQCSKTIDGMLWIGGDVTAGTSTRNAPKGTRTAIVLKPGSPVQGIFIFQGSDPRSASCLAFFDDMSRLGPIEPQPIVGTVQLAP